MLIAKGLSKGKIIAFISIIVIAVGVGGYFLYASYFKGKIDINIPFTQSSGSELFGDNVYLPTVSKFDGSFFTSAEVKDLKNSANLPLRVENIGKVNPFSSPIPTTRLQTGR